MEKWNAYTEDGALINRILVRDEPIPDGLYHLVCEVLVRHIDGSYLTMKRDPTKPVYPGYYEATAGGSALVGETKYMCIARELEEETGIVCREFTEVGIMISEANNAIFHSFVCTVDCPKDSVRVQDGETVDYRWMSEDEFIEFVNSDDMIPSQKNRLLEYFAEMNYLQ